MQSPPPEELAKAEAMIDALRLRLKPLFDALPADSNSAIRFDAGEER